jgi:putative ABC transport system permease protein
VPTADFAARRGNAVSYILVRARPGVDADALAQRLESTLPGTTAQTRDEFVDQESSVVRDMSADIMQIMTLIAFLIALAVIALTLFTVTLSKLREYAVVKALGASTWRLARAVLAQALWTSTFALALAVLLAIAIAAAVGSVTPNIRLAIEPVDVARIAAASIVVGAAGALVPLRHVARVDPATAFKE